MAMGLVMRVCWLSVFWVRALVGAGCRRVGKGLGGGRGSRGRQTGECIL